MGAAFFSGFIMENMSAGERQRWLLTVLTLAGSLPIYPFLLLRPPLGPTGIEGWWWGVRSRTWSLPFKENMMAVVPTEEPEVTWSLQARPLRVCVYALGYKRSRGRHQTTIRPFLRLP